MSTDTTTHGTPTTAASSGGGTKVVDTAQYGLAAFLAALGVWTIVDATGIEPGFVDQSVPPAFFSYLYGGVLLVLAVALAVATARGDVAEGEDGEDVDLDQSTDFRTIGLLVAVLLVNIVLIDVLGWAITGALLFAGAAYVLGSRTPVRDLAIGVALSLGTFYGLYSGLGIPVPAGILDGIL